MEPGYIFGIAFGCTIIAVALAIGVYHWGKGGGFGNALAGLGIGIMVGWFLAGIPGMAWGNMTHDWAERRAIFNEVCGGQEIQIDHQDHEQLRFTWIDESGQVRTTIFIPNEWGEDIILEVTE